MTSRNVYLSASALLVIFALGLLAPAWFHREVGDTGLHGPVAIVAAVPFIAVFAVGSLVLAVAVARSKLSTIPFLVGLTPAGLGVLSALILLFLAATG
jgi:hypothetical protein